MRYVVTGAAGFIGSQLLRTLLDRGHEATGWDAFTDYYDPALKEENARDLPVERVDIGADGLDLDGVDGVFHLAGQPGVKSFGSVFPVYVRHNVLASQRLFEAAAQARVRTVFASSSSIYGDAASYPTPEDTVSRPLSPYGITKLACEHLAQAYRQEFGLDVVTLRYFTIYGPRQRPDMAFASMVAALAENRPFELFGDGTQSRSFTYVADAVEATIGAMEHGSPGSTFNVGGGSEVSMLQAIEALGSIAGRRLEIVQSPRREGDATRTAADTSRIQREIGWEARTSFVEGLAAQWRWAADRVAAA
ncbi:MAG: NAD-dependent epimerase/dehydratase family protein [Thermoleophilia bacterium]|nr:NAD-dependent epimerase/dehydratase family protein [Thermoleophilia bacterium]MDH4340364.1 NAD-dependent epimerase/dehydratase family protein [Thermoleophilia bacterium]MDH5280070.1 NAD-dependent epimerase/dehydratase family protein [Thermoleophilia bacterium]